MITERNNKSRIITEIPIYSIESTGIFRMKSQLQSHINAGAKKVILTVPAKDQIWQSMKKMKEIKVKYQK